MITKYTGIEVLKYNANTILFLVELSSLGARLDIKPRGYAVVPEGRPVRLGVASPWTVEYVTLSRSNVKQLSHSGDHKQWVEIVKNICRRLVAFFWFDFPLKKPGSNMRVDCPCKQSEPFLQG